MKARKISALSAKEIDNKFASQAMEIAEQAEQIAALKHQLEWFQRQLFGRKSEKQLIENPHQTSLFSNDTGSGDSTAPAGTEVQAHRRKSHTQRRGDEVNETGLRFDASVPHEIIELSLPELKGKQADEYEIIDYKETSRLAQRPGSYVVLTYRRPVVRHKTQQTVATMPAPDAIFDGCYADVSVIAGLMVDKAVYHLPLYRQHQRMLDSGITLSRATLTNWIHKGIELLRPIYQAQLEHILQSKVLAMDEVPIKAGRKSKGTMKQTYFWPIYGDQDEIAFTWSSNRGMLHAKQQLTGFTGTLLTDGYAAYSQATTLLNQQDANIVHATCWAHTRRYFEKALNAERESAQHALDLIAQLYRHERHLRDNQLNADMAQEYRLKHSEPVVTEFFNWAHEQRQNPVLLPSNPLLKALNYACERSVELKVFLSNPHVQIDTNHLERALRVIPMGRKNHLFCWSELGAEQLGILQSLMVTCRMQGINPYTYLVDVLQRVSLHPDSQIADLLPRNWKEKFGDDLLPSDLALVGRSNP